MLRDTINRAKFKALQKMFNKKIDKLKTMALNEEYEKFEQTVTRSVLKGEQEAERIIKNGHKFDDNQVNEILNEIDYDNFTHEPSKEFLQELNDLERSPHKYSEFADKFGNFYIDKLKERVNK